MARQKMPHYYEGKVNRDTQKAKKEVVVKKEVRWEDEEILEDDGIVWVHPNSWDCFYIGMRARAKTTSGNLLGSISLIGDFEHGDKNVTITIDDMDGVVISLPAFKYIFIKKDEKNHAEKPVLKGTKGNRQLVVGIKKEQKDDMEVVMAKKVNETVPEPQEDTQNTESGPEYSLSMNGLSKASGVSTITLRKYMEKYASEIPHQKIGNNYKFSEAAAAVVQAIKARNNPNQ